MTDTRHGRAGPEVLRAAGAAALPRKGPSTRADSRRIVRSVESRGHAGAVRFRLPSPLPAETGSLRFRAGGFRDPARGGAGIRPCRRPTPVLCSGFTRLGFSGRGCVQVLQRSPEGKKLVPRLTRLSNPSARPCQTGRRTPRNLRLREGPKAQETLPPAPEHGRPPSHLHLTPGSQNIFSDVAPNSGSQRPGGPRAPGAACAHPAQGRSRPAPSHSTRKLPAV